MLALFPVSLAAYLASLARCFALVSLACLACSLPVSLCFYWPFPGLCSCWPVFVCLGLFSFVYGLFCMFAGLLVELILWGVWVSYWFCLSLFLGSIGYAYSSFGALSWFSVYWVFPCSVLLFELS